MNLLPDDPFPGHLQQPNEWTAKSDTCSVEGSTSYTKYQSDCLKQVGTRSKNICPKKQPIFGQKINTPDSGSELCNKRPDLRQTLGHVTSVYGCVLMKVWSFSYATTGRYSTLKLACFIYYYFFFFFVNIIIIKITCFRISYILG